MGLSCLVQMSSKGSRSRQRRVLLVQISRQCTHSVLHGGYHPRIGILLDHADEPGQEQRRCQKKKHTHEAVLYDLLRQKCVNDGGDRLVCVSFAGRGASASLRYPLDLTSYLCSWAVSQEDPEEGLEADVPNPGLSRSGIIKGQGSTCEHCSLSRRAVLAMGKLLSATSELSKSESLSETVVR